MFKEAAQSSMEKNTDEDGLLLKGNNNADLIRAHGKWGFISKKVKKTVELLAQITFFRGT